MSDGHISLYSEKAAGTGKITAQKIGGEYLCFQGGDLLPYCCYYATLCTIPSDHHDDPTDLNTSAIGMAYMTVMSRSISVRLHDPSWASDRSTELTPWGPRVCHGCRS